MYLILVITSFFFLISCSSPVSNDEKKTERQIPDSYSIVYPEEDSSYLINPGKGWVLYGLPSNHTEASLKYGSVGYGRYNWIDIEPQEGEYNWHIIDNFIAQWEQLGMQAAFGIMAANMHHRAMYVTPEWVFDAGCQPREVQYTNPDTAPDVAQTTAYEGVQVIPQDWLDPVFLEKLENLLQALAHRYNGHPSLAWYEIRSYGNWGEGHLYPWHGEEPSIDQLFQHHIALHLIHFDQTPLIAAETYFRSATQRLYAAQQGVGIRDDGIISYRDGSTTRECEGLAISAFEWGGTYEQFSSQGVLSQLESSIANGKVYYCGFARFGDDDIAAFAQNEVTLIERLTNLMGYHLTLNNVLLPDTITSDQELHLEFTWKNSGVARMWFDAHAAFALLDSDHNVIYRTDLEDFNLRDISPDRLLRQTATVVIPESSSIDDFKYVALGAFTDLNDSSPDVKLALKNRTEENWQLLKEY